NGGYLPLTGAGALGGEVGCPSVTSPFPNVSEILAQLPATSPLAAVPDSPVPLPAPAAALKGPNPHFKFIALLHNGYPVLDIDKDRVQGEWWFVDTIDTRADGESLATAFKTVNGAHHVESAQVSAPKPNPPPPAP